MGGYSGRKGIKKVKISGLEKSMAISQEGDINKRNRFVEEDIQDNFEKKQDDEL